VDATAGFEGVFGVAGVERAGGAAFATSLSLFVTEGAVGMTLFFGANVIGTNLNFFSFPSASGVTCDDGNGRLLGADAVLAVDARVVFAVVDGRGDARDSAACAPGASPCLSFCDTLVVTGVRGAGDGGAAFVGAAAPAGGGGGLGVTDGLTVLLGAALGVDAVDSTFLSVFGSSTGLSASPVPLLRCCSISTLIGSGLHTASFSVATCDDDLLTSPLFVVDTAVFALHVPD